MSVSLRARLLATTCALLSAGAAVGAGAATNIGVTSAVIPAARGTPTEGNTRVLQVGLDMQANERVQTDADGKAHLLFVDGSALSIGPNSDVVLDEFVYDPDSKTGKIALSATRGVFRLVGGQISKTTPVTLATPTATIGVRGGIAAITAGANGVSAAFIYGVDMFVEAQDRVERAERPGSLIQAPAGAPPLPPVPLTAEMVNAQNAAFEGGPGQQSVGGPAVSDEDVAGSQVAILNSTSAVVDVAPAAGQGGPPPPLPAPPTDEVVQASQIPLVEQSREEADDSPGAGSPGIFPVQGAYSGRLKRLDADLLRTLDDQPGQNLGFAGVFSAGGFSGQGENGAPFAVAPRDFSEFGFFGGVADPQPFGGGPLQAFFLPIFGDPEFLLVEMFDPEGGVENDFPFFFGFAGVPTPPAAVPTGGVDAWLLIDFFQGQEGSPFVPPGLDSAFPNLPPQAFVAWNNGAPGASRAFLIPTLAISGQGPSQVSTTSVVVGHLLNDGAGRPFLQSQLRGFSATAGDPASFFSGGISTSDGGDGSDFFGSSAPNFFVLEGSAVDGSDNVTSRGIQIVDSVQEPHFPNVYASPATYAPEARTTRTLNGFASGFVRKSSGAAFQRFDPIRADSDVGVVTDAATNRVSAAIDFQLTFSETSFDVRLGGVSDDGSSAFIDDRTFAAIDRPTPASTLSGFQAASEYSLFVTAQPENVADALPAGVTLCECRHATWGFLASRLENVNGDRVETINTAVVLGEVAQPAQFAATQSATFAGHAFGTVVRGSPFSATSVSYAAFGSFSLGVSFTPGQVNVTSASLTNFDGGNFSLGTPTGPQNAPNYFFSMTGTVPGVVGTVSAGGQGTFVGPGTPPGTTIGRIGGSGVDYQFEAGYVAERPGAP